MIRYTLKTFPVIFFPFLLLTIVGSFLLNLATGGAFLAEPLGWRFLYDVSRPFTCIFVSGIMTVINYYQLKNNLAENGIDTAHLKSADLRPVQTEVIRAACSPDEALGIIQKRLTGRVKRTADNVIEIKTWNFWSPWLGYKTILEFMPRTADSPGRVRITSRSALKLPTTLIDLSGENLITIHNLKRLLCRQKAGKKV